MIKNLILNASNAIIEVTNFLGGKVGKRNSISGLPLGTTGASTSGEIGVKVHVLSGGGGTPPTGTSATQVQGTAADGAAAIGNPVQIGGKDEAGNIQALLTRTDGAALVGLQASTSTTAATLTQGVKTVAASGTPEAIVGVSTLVESVKLTGLKARDTANTGSVFVGFSATNDTQLERITTGASIILSAPPGKKIDLNVIFIDVATNGDGVVWLGVN